MVSAAALTLIIGVPIVLIIIAIIFVWSIFSWNIPIVILQFLGNKGRPNLKITRGKLVKQRGSYALRIKGYPTTLSFKNFKSENWYPTSGKTGALILWELRKGLLTPVVPKRNKLMAKVFGDAKKEATKQEQPILWPMNFEFDEKLYNDIELRAVDDVEIEWMLDEMARVNHQYVHGWRDWLAQNAHMIAWVLLTACIVCVVAIFMWKLPTVMQACANQAVQTSAMMLERINAIAGVTPPPA